MAPDERLAHGLPPKPPAPVQELPDSRRDSRNKKRNENPKGNQDNRQKSQNSNKRLGNQKQQQQRHNRRKSSQGQVPGKATPTQLSDPSKENEVSRASEISDVPEQAREGQMTEFPQAEQVGKIKNATEPSVQPSNEDHEEAIEDTNNSDWEVEAIFRAPARVHSPDEVGGPLPSEYNEEILLPRKWDSKCIKSEFIRPDNLEEFIRPVHETDVWEHFQFDPAFSRDGKLPSGDTFPRLSVSEENNLQEPPSNPTLTPVEHSRMVDDSLSAERQMRKRHSDNSPRRGRELNSQQSPTRESSQYERRRRRRSDSRHRESHRRDHHPPGNPQRREYEQDRRSTPRSRRSSVSSKSSHSSGLDSLDRELLGIDKESDTEKDCKEDEKAPKPKRRRVQIDSAYR